MSSPSVYNKPLHRALLSCDLISLQTLANNHNLDMEAIGKTMYVLSEHSSQGHHITPLQGAIMIGNYRLCKRLIAEGADFFSLSYDVAHPLILALDASRYQIAKLLLTNGADVFLHQHGFYPMYYAIRFDTPEYIVEQIVKAGFSPDGIIESISNTTALHRAVGWNNVPIVKLLLSLGANLNVIDTQEGYTPIHIAVKQRLSSLVQLLAEEGADVEIECTQGFTPIFYAIGNNDVKTIDILLQFGAKIDHLSSVQLIYPLNFAVSLCSIKVTELLLKHGADVRLSTPVSGDLPLHSAAMSQKSKMSVDNAQELEEVVELLIENGSKIDTINNYDRTPMQLAIVEENFGVVDILVKEGAKVNQALDHGTNFHFVARRGSKDLVYTFLEHGADYSYFDINKITPYHIAALNPDLTVLPVFWRFHCPFDLPLLGENSRKPIFPSVVIDLLENQKMFLSGVKSNDVNLIYNALGKGAEARGCSMKLPYPLHSAASSGFASVVQLLLENGVPPNSINNQHETPLHFAAKEGHSDICLNLLKHGAVYNYRSKTKKTPLDLAFENGQEEIVNLLQKFKLLFKSRKERNVCRKLKESACHDINLYWGFINATNRKGETLMAVALKKDFVKLATRIMKFRLQGKI